MVRQVPFANTEEVCMASNKGSTWDKGWFQKLKEKNTNHKGFEDDPRAEEFDKHGRVFNNYGTEEPKVKAWIGDESVKARKRAPKHLFRKKY